MTKTARSFSATEEFKPSSIQVAPTVKRKNDVEVQAEGSNDETDNWSVYLRGEDGSCQWLRDFSVFGYGNDTARVNATVYAANMAGKLSVPIEPIPE